MSQETNCESCNARIRFVRMPSGKLMPVDVKPSFLGNIVLEEDGVNGRVLDRNEKAQLAPGTPLYVSHFVTCTHASAHRMPE